MISRLCFDAMNRLESKANCIGSALSERGLAPDGFYDPAFVDVYLEDVPLSQANLVVGMVNGVVCHVVPFDPIHPDVVVHRRKTGDRVKWKESFFVAIGHLYPDFSRDRRTLAQLRYMAPRKGVNLRQWRQV